MSITNIQDHTFVLNKVYRLLGGYINLSLTKTTVQTTQPLNTTFSRLEIEGTSQSYTFNIVDDPTGFFNLVNDNGMTTGFTRNLKITTALPIGVHSIGVETKDYVGRTFIDYFNITVT